MTLLELSIPPGVKRAGTDYQSRGRWFNTNLVRWFEGAMRPVGGWVTVKDSGGAPIDVSYDGGVTRALHSWRTNDGAAWLAIGTSARIFAYSAGVLTDITDATTVPGTPGSTGQGSAYGLLNYGAHLYGRGTPGSSGQSGSGPLVVSDAAVWTLDNFGQYLVGVLSSDGKFRWWDLDVDNDMIEVVGYDGDVVPENNRAVVVTAERFVMLLGAGGDPRKVAWPSQETLDVWTPLATNTAGDFILDTSGRLQCGRRTPRETLLFTDTDLHSAIYIGDELVFRFERRGANCGILAPGAVSVVGDGAMWWGDGGFFRYDGAVTRIPCEVYDYVSTRLNRSQKQRITSFSNSQFGEVWWFYPSIASEEIDSYVAYNWLENHWSIGSLVRTAGVDRGVFEYPILAAPDGALYEHERGSNRGSETVFAESGAIQLGTGERVWMCRFLIPDEKVQGETNLTIFSEFHPNGSETTHGPYTFGNPTDVRVTGRALRFRFTETDDDKDWRVGDFRFDAAQGGLR